MSQTPRVARATGNLKEGAKLQEGNNGNFTSNIQKKRCFRFEYDGRNLMVEKQVQVQVRFNTGHKYYHQTWKNTATLLNSRWCEGSGAWLQGLCRQRPASNAPGLHELTFHKWLAAHYDNLNRPDTTTWIYSKHSSSSFSSIHATAVVSQNYPAVASYLRLVFLIKLD